MFTKWIFSLSLLCLSAGTLSAQTHYTANVSNSRIYWEGHHIGGGSHEGYILLHSGELKVNGRGQVTQGAFFIDMNTIFSTDMGEDHEGLDNHLKNEDFFDVAVYPEAIFTVTGWEGTVQPGQTTKATITGNFTMKGITHAITFPATVAWKGSAMHATAEFKIDRTRWNVMYQSGNLWTTLKDQVILNDIPLKLDIYLTAPGQ